MNTETGEVSMDYERSAEIGALAAALAKAQGAIEAAKKDSVNPHFKSKYADLASVMEVAKGPLSSNGLAIIQAPSTDNGRAVVTTELVHASGQWVRSTMRLPVGQQTPQGYGSAFTYGRRYGYAAMVGIAADEDDDGNAASAGSRNNHSKPVNGEDVKAKLDSAPSGVPSNTDQQTDAPPIPYGSSKGKRLTEVDNKDLKWLLETARENVLKEDPKWGKKNEQWLAHVEAECARRRENAKGAA